MDLLSMEVREKLDRIVSCQPSCEDPVVLRFDPSSRPRRAPGPAPAATTSPPCAALPNGSSSRTSRLSPASPRQVKGGLEEEIQVEIDQERLAALGIPLDRMRQVVGVGNVNLPGGALRGRTASILVRTINEYRSRRSATLVSR
jgi:hydrophobic/amphiphilic exporter-1 (mainly G- bacteria), HAE1 family